MNSDKSSINYFFMQPTDAGDVESLIIIKDSTTFTQGETLGIFW